MAKAILLQIIRAKLSPCDKISLTEVPGEGSENIGGLHVSTVKFLIERFRLLSYLVECFFLKKKKVVL